MPQPCSRRQCIRLLQCGVLLQALVQRLRTVSVFVRPARPQWRHHCHQGEGRHLCACKRGRLHFPEREEPASGCREALGVPGSGCPGWPLCVRRHLAHAQREAALHRHQRAGRRVCHLRNTPAAGDVHPACIFRHGPHGPQDALLLRPRRDPGHGAAEARRRLEQRAHPQGDLARAAAARGRARDHYHYFARHERPRSRHGHS
mmetsp:Transcript_49192/g.142561  ORF Transcript_49192/g.142561 Transcript_49192/m.142561 type:complete len:203 (+) Transcript_49192:346-954(+)